MAPGAIVSIFGNNLAPGTQAASTTPLPTSLAATSVSFNNVPAPLFFVSAGQINAQVPFGVSAGAVQVAVNRNGAVTTGTVSMSGFSPGIFTVNQQGTGTGAILHAANFTAVTSTSPASAGEFIAIFLTGLGTVNPAVASGAVAPTISPLAETPTRPTVTIAGVPAAVSFSGLAPGFVGLYQVNVQVPAGLPSGSQTLQLTMNGITANPVTVAVR